MMIANNPTIKTAIPHRGSENNLISVNAAAPELIFVHDFHGGRRRTLIGSALDFRKRLRLSNDCRLGISEIAILTFLTLHFLATRCIQSAVATRALYEF
jgi:hypothetical protein